MTPEQTRALEEVQNRSPLGPIRINAPSFASSTRWVSPAASGMAWSGLRRFWCAGRFCDGTCAEFSDARSWRRFKRALRSFIATTRLFRLLEDSLPPTTASLLGWWISERERCRESGTGLLRTDWRFFDCNRGSFAGLTSQETSTLAAALQVFWVFNRYNLTDRYAASLSPLAS